MAKAPNPLDEDPEKANPTVAKPNPLRAGRKSLVPSDDDEETNPIAPPDGEVDPERANKTAARAPMGRRPSPAKKASNPRSSAVEVSESLEGDAEYHTGQNYRAMHDADDEAQLAPADSLDGEGLEPMDPEMVPRTRQLALEGDPDAEPEVDHAPEADDENSTRAGPPVQLEIVAGPDAGQKRRFKGVRMVIGRTPGVDFQLSDQSVSRRHIELVHGDAGTVMRDLGSGNGTKVNGEKVAEKVLEHGDEIALGKTRIRYIDEVAAFKKAREESEQKEAAAAAAAQEEAAAPAEGAEEPGEAGADDEDEAARSLAESAEGAEAGEAPAAEGEEEPAAARDRSAAPVKTARGRGEAVPDRKAPSPMRMLIIAGAVLVVMIIAVGLLTRKPPPTTEELSKAKAETKMNEARTAARENRFADAISFADEAERLNPGIDKSKIAASAREELAVQKAIDDARGFLDKKQFEDVRKTLAQAPKGSGRLDEQRNKVEADLAAAELQYKKDQIDSFIASGDIEPAKVLLGTLPVEEQGPSARKIGDFEAQLDQIKKDEEHSARQNAAAAAISRKLHREEEVLLAFAAVERKFAGAEWERAASECPRVIELHQTDKEIVSRAQRLMSLIPNFGRNYEEGTRKFKQGQLAQAAKPLRAAHQIYQQINLRQNPYGAELEQNLAQASLIAGREALLRNDLSSAAQNFRDVVRLDPSEKRGKEGLDETISKAEELFNDAYTVRSLDPRDAQRKLKVVIEVTPVGSTTHEKAKNVLAAMPQ